MTLSGGGASSMKYSLDEVFSGMLASSTKDSFTSDSAQLAKLFEGLSGQFPMFAPFASGVDPAAVEAALTKLVTRKILTSGAGAYNLSEAGKATCTSGKRTLFNQSDRLQLEAAVKVFDEAV
ncbi:MAG: hypothetical protein NTZ05_03340 [Chloroflexi bacterium]|nr:hypothetical protein [Chloroflexota bacterium]